MCDDTIDTMDKWDEEKLRSVVMSKAGNPRTTTDVRMLLVFYPEPDLSPRRLYASTLFKLSRQRSLSIRQFHASLPHGSFRFGWFWECPDGDGCRYRHALPPGFVLKSQRKALEDAEKGNTISLEEFLEVEVCNQVQFLLHDTQLLGTIQRHKLGSNLTPVTPETFAKWKQTRMNKKMAEEEAVKKAKDTQAAAGKSSGMSGRDLVRDVPRYALHIYTYNLS